MSSKLKQVNRAQKLKLAVASGAVVIGAAYLILKSFPHIRTSIYDYISGDSHDDDEEEGVEDNPAEFSEQIAEDTSILALGELSVFDVGQWSDDNLKSWLHSKEISPPLYASHDHIVSLVKSIQEASSELQHRTQH